MILYYITLNYITLSLQCHAVDSDDAEIRTDFFIFYLEDAFN